MPEPTFPGIYWAHNTETLETRRYFFANKGSCLITKERVKGHPAFSFKGKEWIPMYETESHAFFMNDVDAWCEYINLDVAPSNWVLVPQQSI